MNSPRAFVAGHRHPAHPVVVGKEVAVEPREAELPAERARDAGSAARDAAGVHDQVRAAARGDERVPFGGGQRARVADLHRERGQARRIAGELLLAPAPVADVVVGIERAAAVTRCDARPVPARPPEGHWRLGGSERSERGGRSSHSPRVAEPPRGRRGVSSSRPAIARCSVSVASGASLSITCVTAHVHSCPAITSATRWPRQRRNA